MGSRFFFYYPCPKCEDEDFYIYDAPSSMMHVGVCSKCGYRDPHEYIEEGEVLKLALTKECPKCGRTMWEINGKFICLMNMPYQGCSYEEAI